MVFSSADHVKILIIISSKWSNVKDVSFGTISTVLVIVQKDS